MTTSKPITDSELMLIETAARSDSPSRLNTIVLDLVAEIRRQRAVLGQVDAATRRVEAGIDRVAEKNTQLLTALAHLDAIIGAYDAPGILPLLNAIRDAKKWRESIAKTVEHVG